MTRTNLKPVLSVLLLAVLASVLVSTLFINNAYSFAFGPNWKNVSVDTKVNITQSLPSILIVTIDDGSQVAKNITLNAGTFKNITCNATIQDWNGGATIDNVTATFFNNQTGGILDSSPDNNNTHYSNSNCTLGVPSGFLRNASCSFQVMYYANNSGWACNVTVIDDYSFNATVNRSRSLANATNIDAIYALNVSPVIDYGNMAVGDWSWQGTGQPNQANVTNIGNRNINISVRGYGNASNDGLAMVCQIGAINISNEKYNINGGTDPTTYTNLTNNFASITGLIVPKQTNAATLNFSTNTTYWALYVPPNPFGLCNGTVVFQAESTFG